MHVIEHSAAKQRYEKCGEASQKRPCDAAVDSVDPSAAGCWVGVVPSLTRAGRTCNGDDSSEARRRWHRQGHVRGVQVHDSPIPGLSPHHQGTPPDSSRVP